MKTATPNISRISPAVRAAVAAILDTDGGISHAHRLAILTACDTPPATLPSVSEMPAREAAQILGKSLQTVLRWIESGKLEGRQFGNRLWVVSSDSVERLRASLAKPSPAAPAPLPSRLAHLANRIPTR